MSDTKKFYLTTPIYYVNARPHIGHAYSTIAADVIARRHRLLGDDTFFLTGTDEHGQKVQRSAEKAGIPPQQFTDEVSATFRDLWKRMGITNDDYIRTTDPRHKRGVQKLWTDLESRGAIYLSSYTGQYSIGEEMFIDGPPGTIGPDGKPTETVTEENYFFRLSDYQLPLLNLIESGELHIQPETTRNEVLSFLRGNVATVLSNAAAALSSEAVILSEAKDPCISPEALQHSIALSAAGTPYIPGALKDLSISRTTFDWGIPVPGNPKHVIYVWLDALANYMTAVGYGSEDPADQAKFAKYWPADLHLVGKEITRFHCVYWPAFLMAAGLPLPKSIVANGWLLFEESKMSKSRGNIVRTETILDAFGALCPAIPPPSDALIEATSNHVILSGASQSHREAQSKDPEELSTTTNPQTSQPQVSVVKRTGFSPSVDATPSDAALATEGMPAQPTTTAQPQNAVLLKGTASTLAAPEEIVILTPPTASTSAAPEEIVIFTPPTASTSAAPEEIVILTPPTASTSAAPEEIVILSEAKDLLLSDAPQSSTKAQQDLFASDLIRYFLLREIPFGQDGSFSFDALVQRYNSDLANGYGNLVSRTLTMINNYFGEIPAADSGPNKPNPVNLPTFEEGLKKYEFGRTLEGLWTAIAKTDGDLSAAAPWKLAKNEDAASRIQLATVLYDAAESIRIITALLYPVMPYATAKVWAQLGLGDIEIAARNGDLKDLKWGGLKPGTKLGPLSPIFPRADKGIIEIMNTMEQKPAGLPHVNNSVDNPSREHTEFREAPIASESATPALNPIAETIHPIAPAEPETPQIAIDDFAKIDLRVAQIIVAERIPKADKLLRLEVDLGHEKRQILSGIAQWYTPEELIGRKIVIIANLAPRKMRGLESHGMLLAASHGDDGKPVLATFGEDIALGSRLR